MEVTSASTKPELKLSDQPVGSCRPRWGVALAGAPILTLLAVTPLGLARDSGQPTAAAALFPLLAAAVAVHLRALDRARLASAILIAWGLLAALARVSVTLPLAGLALSLQPLALILLVILVMPQLFLHPPARPTLLALGFAGLLVLLAAAPALVIPGALTLQTPQVLVHALLFILLLEPLRRCLESFAVRFAFSVYVVVLLVAVAAIQGMSHP